MRWIQHLRYFAADAWDEWKHSPGVNLLAMSTLTAALFLAALVVLLLVNVRRQVDIQRQAVPVEVYLLDQIPESRRLEIERLLVAESGVERVEFIGKQEALDRYREWAAQQADLVDELEANPLPAAFEVYLEAGPVAEAAANRIIKSLTGADGVEDVRFDRDWLQHLDQLVAGARKGSLVVAVVVFGAVVLVMASVLRLAVFARRDEIEIMLLVGATPGFVRGPFLVAGLFQGVLASVVAVAAVEGARYLFLSRVETGSVMLDLAAASPLSPFHIGGIVIAGVLVSLTGSFFAVRLRAF